MSVSSVSKNKFNFGFEHATWCMHGTLHIFIGIPAFSLNGRDANLPGFPNPKYISIAGLDFD